LTKFYGSNCAADKITFDVNPGEVLGFLGPNGSGKTTVIRMLLGLISISGGWAEILGKRVSPSHPHARTNVGYLPGTLGLYRNQTVREFFAFLNSMRGGQHMSRALELSARLAINPDLQISGLSKGNKQKVGVIQAFMHSPIVLILDEPTVGLDPIVQREFEEILSESVAEGAAVLLSSHVMREVERVAHRVAILDHGRLLVVNDVKGLTSHLARRLTFDFPSQGAAEVLRGCDGVVSVEETGSTVECSIIGPETALLATAVRLGVISVTSREPTLDDVFFSTTGNRRAS
jgi:ABC-2 type transport system ATP-binding protein